MAKKGASTPKKHRNRQTLADVNRPPGPPSRGRPPQPAGPESAADDEPRPSDSVSDKLAFALGNLTREVTSLVIDLRKANEYTLADELSRRLTLFMIEATSSKPQESILKALAQELETAANTARTWARRPEADGLLRARNRRLRARFAADGRDFLDPSVTAEGIIEAATAVVGAIGKILPIIPPLIGIISLF